MESNLKMALTNPSLLRRSDQVIAPLNTMAANIQAFRTGTPQNVVPT